MIYFNRIIIILITALLHLASPLAHASNIYTIEDIEITETGKSGTSAQKKAITRAQRDAFNTLFKRLTPSSFHTELPELTDEDISSMVQGIDIKKENITRGRYFAIIDITFNRNYIRQLLKANKVPYSVKTSQPIVVVPILNQNNQLLLWDNINPWRDAWQKAIARSGLVRFVLPTGDLSDMTVLNAEKLIHANLAVPFQSQFGTLLKKYNSSNILIAEAKIFDSFSSNEYLEVDLRLIGNGQDEVYTEQFKSDDESLRGSLITAANQIVKGINNSWKQQNRSTLLADYKLVVKIPYRNLSEWLAIKNRLQRLNFVEKLEIQEVTTQYAGAHIFYKRNRGNVLELIKNSGFYLEKSGNNFTLGLQYDDQY